MSLLQKAKNNVFFSNTFFIFIIRFFPSLANLAVVIYYSHRLPATQYGQYQNFWIVLNILYPFICFGMHLFAVTYKPSFLARLIKGIRMNEYLLFALWTSLIGLIFAFVQVQLLHMPFWLSFAFIVSYAAGIVLEALLMVFKNFKSLIVINVLFSLLYFAAHWHILNNGFSITVIYNYLLVLYGAKLLIYFMLILAAVKQQPVDTGGMDYKLPEVRSLWLHLGIYDILQNNSGWIDKFAVSIFLSSQLSAIYFNGSINIPFLPLLLSAALSAVLMQLAHVRKEHEVQQTVQLMNQTGKILSGVVFPLFCFLLFFRSEVIVTLYSAKYLAATPVFLMSILVLPLRAYSFTTILQSRHKGNIINAGAFMEVALACMLMYPLYKLLGLPGIALSFVITTYLQAAFYLYHSAQLLQVSILRLIPLGNWVAKLIIFSLLFITAHYIASLYFTDKIILILGTCLLVITIPVALIVGLKTKRGNGNTAQTV